MGLPTLFIGVSMLIHTFKLTQQVSPSKKNHAVSHDQRAWVKVNSQTQEESYKKNLSIHIALIILLSISFFLGMSYRSSVISLPAIFQSMLADIQAPPSSIASTASPDKIETKKNYNPNSKTNNSIASSLLVSLIYAFTMLGQFFGGKCADKYDLKKIYLIFHSLALATLILIIIALIFLPRHFNGLYLPSSFFPLTIITILFAIYAFFVIGMQPIENTFVFTLANKKILSFIYACKFVIVMGSGALVLQGLNHLPNLIANWQVQQPNHFIQNPLTSCNPHQVTLVRSLSSSFQWLFLFKIICLSTVVCLAFTIYLILARSKNKQDVSS